MIQKELVIDMKRCYIIQSYPHLLHGADYNPEQWVKTKEIWDEDMRLMNLANCNEMTVGVFAWAVLEPREGEYDFSFLDEILDKVYAAGGRVVLATPSGARPRWLAEKYPEVLRVNDRRERFHFSERHNHCYTSPIYREKVKNINTLLAQRYGKHPAVVAWHISNEYGGQCYCPLCQNAFREYLKNRYDADIEKLNDAYWSTFWSHQYDSFDQIEAPSPLTDRCMHGLNLDWRRFVSHQTLDFMNEEIAAIKAVTPDLPVTTNMMHDFYDLDYRKFAHSLDVISWDSYPNWHNNNQVRVATYTAFWHDFFRSLKQRPFMLMESAPGLVNWKTVNKLKRPGMDKLAALQAIAHGSDTVQYFQWRKSRGSVEKFHGAVVDHVGTENTRIFRAVQDTGKILKNIDEVAGSCVKSCVAVIFEWENRWALDNAQGFKTHKDYTRTCVDYYEQLWMRGISTDIIGVEDDWNRYDLVIAPMLYMTSETTAQKMADYVSAGGHLYATYMLGMADETDLCHLGGFPCGVLKDVFGIWNEEIDTLYGEERVKILAEQKTYEGHDFCELIHTKGAKVLAEYASEFYAGMPAFTENAYGKGVAWYQAFRDTGAFRKAMLERILISLNIQGVVPQLPEGVSAHCRYGENVCYLFAENYTDREQMVLLGQPYRNMESGEITKQAVLPPFGVSVFKR